MANENLTDEDVNRILFLGTHQYKWDDLGVEVIYSLFGVGTRETNEVKLSGLDQQARDYVGSILDLANCLLSVGKYNFDSDYGKKLQFVRGLQDPVFLLFVEHYRRARIEQAEAFKKARDNLKKERRILSSEPSGSR